MPGIVKVGKTNRDPKDRLRKLSAATGIPTPFVLVYSAYFADCLEAEQFVHAMLESYQQQSTKFDPVLFYTSILVVAYRHDRFHTPTVRQSIMQDILPKLDLP